MKRRVEQSVQARRDVKRHFVHIGTDDLGAAERFVDALRRARKTLAEYPEIGSTRNFRSDHLRGARMWPVPDFDKYLIFYRLAGDSIQVLRVIHSLQDYTRIFDDD